MQAASSLAQRRLHAFSAPRGMRASPVVAAPLCRRARVQLPVQASADPQTTTSAAGASSSSSSPQQAYVPDADGFSITKVSFGSILTPVGLGLLVYGFGSYFTILPGTDISSLLLIYGFPITLLGFALSYAQLEPVGCRSTQAALDLRDSQMTDIQKQIREDCTRYRYGDEQHLEEALDKIFRFGKQGGLPRRLAPRLVGLREETVEGAYTLVLEFEAKLEEGQWQERQPKIQTFFGPGIKAEVKPSAAGADVFLVCDGTGAGRSGKEKKDVLPPLMPGLPARQQE